MFSKVILVGRLTADPVLKTTNQGTNVCAFCVAVDENSSTEKRTSFINCVAWKGTAEFICRYWHKGKPIGVDGKLQTRNYTDKNGDNKTATEVVVNNVFFTGDSKETETQAPKVDFTPLSNDEDLPF